MASVRNERATNFVFGQGANRKTLLPGQTVTITPDELGQVPIQMRGPGGINVLTDNQASTDSAKIKFDYYAPFGEPELRYFGQNTQSSLDTDSTWVIRRFEHTQVGSETKISEIQILDQVAWGASTAARDGLAWT